MPRFLHAADLHLDSPLHGLERYDGAPLDALRGATRRALENLVRVAIDQQVECVVLAGDLYDGDWRDFNTGLFFIHQMLRLREAQIPVYRLSGNHDAQSEITKALRLPDNVYSFDTRKPNSFHLEHSGIALHGQGFAKREVTKNLVETYPRVSRDGLLHIGVLHTSLSGFNEHEPYAPCSIADLQSRGYHYWALGHVHKRQVLRQDPWIVFPGNTQGRHIRETGSKGCSLVTYEGNTITEVVHLPLETLRWEKLWVDVTNAPDPDAVRERIREKLRQQLQQVPELTLALRLEITGACRAHEKLQQSRTGFIAELRRDALDDSNGRLWLEKIVLETRSMASLERLEQDDGPLGSLYRAMQQLDPEHPALQALRRELKALRDKGLEDVLPESMRDETLTLETLEQLRQGLVRELLPQVLSLSEAP